MTPDLVRALRLKPRLRKRLRECREQLLTALDGEDPGIIVQAARAWAETERQAERDVAEKTADPPKHRVSFLVEETYYKGFCETAIDNELAPSEVARRYCISGYTFASLIWSTVRRGGSVGDWVRVAKGRPNLAEIALPDFSTKG